MSITIQSEGRRHYIIGQTYPIRDQLRAVGANWDPARKAWWTGKRAVAEQFASMDTPAKAPAENRAPRDGMDSVVAGRATYKGRSYYVAGRKVRGDTRWDDGVEAVTTRDGQKVLLYFRDGSSQFWASRAEVQIVKRYERPQTLRSLAQYAEQARKARDEGRERCDCGAYHTGDEQGCYMCGCPRCDGAAPGGLCQHD